MNQGRDPYQLALAGTDLIAKEAGRLESLLKSNPDDLEIRTQLLGYYMQRSFTDSGARRRKSAHCLWMIRHHPGKQIVGSPFCQVERLLDAAGYRKAKALWKEQVEKRSSESAVLANAAYFHTADDSRTAIALLKRLQHMEPQNPLWHERLGHLHYLHSGVAPGRKRDKAAAHRALKEWQAALALHRTALDRFHLLTRMAPVAVDAGRPGEAIRYAAELLRHAKQFRSDWNHGNALHYAHVALGRVALRGNRMRDAKKHLIASARTPGSPQLNSFGPSQELAAEVLARGETKTVLRYLELCRKFWAMGQQQIDAWTRSIRESGSTDFMPVFDALPSTPGPKARTRRR